jgi:shikimate kinase
MKQSQNLFLIGPMGAGKSAVGRQLARLLHLDFLDSDEEVENRTGVDIPFIFEKEGEEGFRKRESKVIDELTRRQGVVLATGGGAVVDPDNRSQLGARGYVIYLHTTVQQQLDRTQRGRNRPLLEKGDRVFPWPRGTVNRWTNGFGAIALRFHGEPAQPSARNESRSLPPKPST